jgi:ribosome-binding factor A
MSEVEMQADGRKATLYYSMMIDSEVDQDSEVHVKVRCGKLEQDKKRANLEALAVAEENSAAVPGLQILNR